MLSAIRFNPEGSSTWPSSGSPMKCYQCERPAIYKMGEQGPGLCVDCAHKAQDIANKQFLLNAAMMNQALDDMDAVVGFSSGSGRIPVSEIARSMQEKTVLNNIRISNSSVGVLNTGDLARIDAVITFTNGTNVESVGQLLRKLTQSVVDSEELDAKAKKDVLDLIEALADLVVGARSNAKASVARVLVDGITDKLKKATDLTSVIEAFREALAKLFGF